MAREVDIAHASVQRRLNSHVQGLRRQLQLPPSVQLTAEPTDAKGLLQQIRQEVWWEHWARLFALRRRRPGRTTLQDPRRVL